MAKYTKEMEYNELAKRGECFCATSNCGGYGIVVNAGGDAVATLLYGPGTHGAKVARN
jgi:hypothetical protein